MGISSCTGPSREMRSYRLYDWVRRWDVDGEPGGSSTFAVDVELVFLGGTRSLWRIQTLSLSTAFISYSWDWLEEEEVMSILQNTLFKSKLLKAIDSAMVCSEEVDLESFTNNTVHAVHKAKVLEWNSRIIWLSKLEYQLSKNPVKQRQVSIHWQYNYN